MMPQFLKKNILPVALCVFLLTSFAGLSYLGKVQAGKSYRSDWWALYFSEPKEKNLDFVIENQGPASLFRWRLLHDNAKAAEGEILVGTGELRRVDPGISAASGRYSVIVVDQKAQKEIAKGL